MIRQVSRVIDARVLELSTAPLVEMAAREMTKALEPISGELRIRMETGEESLVTADLSAVEARLFFASIIKSASVVRLSSGPDHCYLRLPFPNPMYPFEGDTDVRFTAARGTGVDYILRVFGVQAELVVIT